MKSYYIFIGIVGVAIIGTGAFWSVKTQDEGSKNSEKIVLEGSVSTTTATTEPVIAQDGTYVGSLNDLARSGKAYQCTVNHTVQGITSSGVVYISGENIKAEFSSEVPIVGAVKTHMIADRESVYTWTSLMPQGFKVKRIDTTSQTQQQVNPIDFNQKLAYTCVAWTPDMSVFALPTNLMFKTI